jgi:hypothetical protein
MMHMTAALFSLKDIQCLFLTDPARSFWVVFNNHAGERLTNDQADVQRQAWVLARYPAWTIQDNDVVGILQDQIACQFIGNNLFWIRDANFFTDAD